MPIDINKEEIYQTIGKGVDSALKEFRREYLPSRVLVDMLDTWPEESVELFLASYPETPSMLLERLAYTCKHGRVLCAVASHPRTSAKVMQDLASHKEDEVRLMLAANKQISPQTAALLSEDDCILVRSLLAANPALPTRIMKHLVTDPAPMVRAVFCSQKALDKELLNKLLMDPDHLVKARTSLMSKVEDEVLLSWADSDELFAQLFLLCRKNIPPKAMESLCFSQHKEIQKLAIQHKHLAEDEQLGWAADENFELRQLVAGKEELTEKVQLLLANDESPQVLFTLAQNPNLCPQAAELLARSSEPSTCSSLLERQDLSENSLSEICKSCSEDIAFELALNHELNDTQCKLLAERFGIEIIYVMAKRSIYTTSLSREQVVELVNSRIPTLVAFVMRSKCLKSAELEKFVAHPCKSVRLAVLENENISRSILDTLVQDTEGQVSSLAAKAMLRLDEQQAQELAARVTVAEIKKEKVVKKAIEVEEREEVLAEEDRVENMTNDQGLIKKILKKVIRKPKQGDE